MKSIARFVLSGSLVAIAAGVFAQAPSRGTITVHPVVFDKSGTDTSRAKAEAAVNEILTKGGFKLIANSKSAETWRAKGFRQPTSTRPPSAQNLVAVGRAVGARYVCAVQVAFHTRSIWVNLGPKTVSTCHMVTTIVDSRSGKIVHDSEVDGRSDEKSDGLKVAAALLITPLVTAVSGGPKTPQEIRAAQIAAARSLEKFVTVDGSNPDYVGSWQWIRFDGMDDQVIKVKEPGKYVLNLSSDGSANGVVDLNRFTGKYSVNGASMKFGNMATTKVAVPAGSLHDKFLQGLRDASSYVLRDGQLNIALKIDGGIMVFRRVK